MTQGLVRSYQELRWTDDMDQSAAETASDLESLEQDVLHILGEVLASNLADPNSGCGVVGYLSGSSLQLGGLPAIIDAQLANVTRITASSTTLTQDEKGTWHIGVLVKVGADVVNLQFIVGPGGLLKG